MVFIGPTLREIFSMPARLRYRRALRAKTWDVPTDRIALNYGDVIGGAGFVAGGRVKLLHLAERWPAMERFNVLYLVSSAPPPFADELVRWARARGIRFVWNQNGVGFPAWAGWNTLDVNRGMARLRRRADFIVYQTQFCERSANAWLGEAHASSEVLYNPVDTAIFRPAAKSPDLREGWRLLAAGTHYQPFRVIGALETARALLDAGHRVQLTVAGAMRWPDAEAQVHNTIARLHLAEHVNLRPAFSQAEAAGLYQAAHLLLHLKYHDPCPTVVIEALACGLPVVGTRSGGLPELVGEEAGELLQVSNDWWRASYPPARRVAAAVARIIADLPRRASAARARALEKFDKDKWVSAHARIFEQLLPVAGGAPARAIG
jgi:glycosyltransferase involved in cell wall biosynthesis